MRIAPLLCAATLLLACGDDTAAPGGDGGTAQNGDGATTGGDGGGAGGDGSAAPTDGIINAPDGPIPDGGVWVHDGSVLCIPRACAGHIYECGDCLDNDGDGRIDSEDPDCLGACQNNEKGFYGNIPGQNNAPCKMDCYWDQDTGSGNDTCEWDHGCDPHETMGNPEQACSYDPTVKFPGNGTCASKLAAQPGTCKSFCGPLTPNGCDCFGCCVLQSNLSTTDGVWLGSSDGKGAGTCDEAHLGDATKCRPCEIVTACFKPCGHCQLCVGKTELPPDCFGGAPDGGTGDGGTSLGDGGLTAPDGGVSGQCSGGEQPCGVPGEPACPTGFYCITGCCQALIQ